MIKEGINKQKMTFREGSPASILGKYLLKNESYQVFAGMNRLDL